MLESIGYFYGLGALIIALTAFAIGRFASCPPIAAAASAGEREREQIMAADPQSAEALTLG
jgi:hypothetical protein